MPNWDNDLGLRFFQETVGTGLLIPVLGGLVELFVAKQVLLMFKNID